MIFEDRMAELGVETRDFVPDDEHCKRLYDKFYAEAERICEKMSMELDAPFMVSLLLVAVANRDDIIDRMETRIVNLTLKRDSLKECMKYMKYDEDGYYQDSLRIRCENCPFMIDGECRVKEENKANGGDVE